MVIIWQLTSWWLSFFVNLEFLAPQIVTLIFCEQLLNGDTNYFTTFKSWGRKHFLCVHNRRACNKYSRRTNIDFFLWEITSQVEYWWMQTIPLIPIILLQKRTPIVAGSKIVADRCSSLLSSDVNDPFNSWLSVEEIMGHPLGRSNNEQRALPSSPPGLTWRKPCSQK